MTDRIEKSLLKSTAYPEHTRNVELIQTHISYVFITDRFVYKVKKSVNFGFLDFSTLEKRKHYCEQEVALNRRLSPQIYLAVLPVIERNGHFRIGGNGKETSKLCAHAYGGVIGNEKIVDYAVKMKKLPVNRLMSQLLKENKLIKPMITAVARKIVMFHTIAVNSKKISEFGKIKAIRQNTDENFEQTKKYIGRTITKMQFETIRHYTNKFFIANKSIFLNRIRKKKIRDCHGDIHMEHVCISKPIVIFDCIEFNDRFRYSDTAADVAFLAMDLDFNKRSDLARVLIDSYVRYSGDTDIYDVLDFYKIYRAYVRGKVISFLLNDPDVSPKEIKTATAKATRYFELAYSYAIKPRKPTLIITSGLMGTGKSSVAKALGRVMGISIVSSDIIRKKLAGIPETEHRYDDYDSGIYSEAFSERVYKRMLEIARKSLAEGQSLILDATFSRKEQRKYARIAALKCGANFLCIELKCPEKIIKDRLEKRNRTGGDVSDGRWEIFHRQKVGFEDVNEFSVNEHVIANTTKAPVDIAVQINKILK